jgi:DNA-binding NarL/FixJ family response regulator
MIQIALADDHAILRKGVAELISKFDDMCVIIEAGNGKELIEKISIITPAPDVCIVDINMPEMNGYDTTKAIKRNWPDIHVLALSMYDTEQNIIKMLRCGACGYLLKDSDPLELERAIRHAYKDGFYHSELITGRMKRMVDENDKTQELSEKELQFLNLCCSELTYKEIAERMFLSPRTIDGYREALFAKLNITSRTGLAIYAIKTGLITLN